MRPLPFLALGIIGVLSAPAHAVELVQNGDFEASPAGLNWTLTGIAEVGNYSTLLGPTVPTRVLWLGGVQNALDTGSQAIATAGYGTATLSFRLVLEDLDLANSDFFTVSFGSHVLDTIDIGETPGDQLENYYVSNRTYDLSPFFDGTPQTLTFGIATDGKAFTASSAWIDNVSIDAQPVPEPASLLAFGAGALALLRRRPTR